MNLMVWQAKFLIAGLLILPLAPFLYVQGKIARRKVGVLPDAEGETMGLVPGNEPAARLLIIGESTVAGLGARTHDVALAGQFARNLSNRIGRAVSWTVIGKSGVTARQTIRELLPKVPDEEFDYILIGLGGNDVMKLSSPRRWRSDMTRLIEILRERSPRSTIFVTNCPVIRLSPAIPHPIKGILWELSKMHDANIKEFSRSMKKVFYYHQPETVPAGFFADGIHPSELGYRAWSEAMMKFFSENYEW
jgi:lysophospholipase L1-like esterase